MRCRGFLSTHGIKYKKELIPFLKNKCFARLEFEYVRSRNTLIAKVAGKIASV